MWRFAPTLTRSRIPRRDFRSDGENAPWPTPIAAWPCCASPKWDNSDSVVPLWLAASQCAKRSERSVNLMRVAMLELFQVVQRLGTIEELDVLGLRRRKPTHGPAQMDEVRLDRQGNRMHPDLLRQAVGLPSIARPARRDDVRPIVRPTAR